MKRQACSGAFASINRVWSCLAYADSSAASNACPMLQEERRRSADSLTARRYPHPRARRRSDRAADLRTLENWGGAMGQPRGTFEGPK